MRPAGRADLMPTSQGHVADPETKAPTEYCRSGAREPLRANQIEPIVGPIGKASVEAESAIAGSSHSPDKPKSRAARLQPI